MASHLKIAGGSLEYMAKSKTCLVHYGFTMGYLMLSPQKDYCMVSRSKFSLSLTLIFVSLLIGKCTQSVIL